MTSINSVKLRNKFSDFLNRTAYGKERIIITRRGQNLGVLIPMEDLELLQKLEDIIDIIEAHQALQEPGEITLEQIENELGL